MKQPSASVAGRSQEAGEPRFAAQRHRRQLRRDVPNRQRLDLQGDLSGLTRLFDLGAEEVLPKAMDVYRDPRQPALRDAAVRASPSEAWVWFRPARPTPNTVK